MSNTPDSFELACNLDAVLNAWQRRKLGHVVHAVVDARVLAVVGRLFDFSRTPVAAPTLYERILKLARLIDALNNAQRSELENALAEDRKAVAWRAMCGSQTAGYECAADCDVILLAGGGGSGKTDVSIAIGLFQSLNARFVRKTSLEFSGIYKRLGEIIGTTNGRNLSSQSWHLPAPYGFQQRAASLEFSSLAEPESMLRLQGRPVDTLIVDDAGSGQIPKADIDFVSRWLRSTANVRKRLVYSANPPSSRESLYLRDEIFAPWLSPSYSGTRAKSGERRAFIVNGDESREVPLETEGAEVRSVVMSTVHDNPRYVRTGYVEQLKRSPTDVLRRRLLENDWSAGWDSDDAMQVIPSAWVDAAMKRWTETAPGPVDAIGVDIARGGKDKTVLIRRAGDYFFHPIARPGSTTPDGQAVFALLLGIHTRGAIVFYDGIGVGAGLDVAKGKLPIVSVIVSTGTVELDATQTFGFSNVRSLLHWRAREALNPDGPRKLALPPDPLLKQELCAAHYEVRGGKIYVESRDEIFKRLKRSNDLASGFVLALLESNSILCTLGSTFGAALQRSNAAWERRRAQA